MLSLNVHSLNFPKTIDKFWKFFKKKIFLETFRKFSPNTFEISTKISTTLFNFIKSLFWFFVKLLLLKLLSNNIIWLLQMCWFRAYVQNSCDSIPHTHNIRMYIWKLLKLCEWFRWLFIIKSTIIVLKKNSIEADISRIMGQH